MPRLLLLLIIFCTSAVFARPAQLPDWQVSLGLMQIMVPKYRGGSEYRLYVVPTFNLQYKKWFFANAYQGVGINVIHTKHWRVGSSVRYNFGGNDERSERFPGLDDINDKFLAGAFVNYRYSLFSLGFNTYRALGKLKGSGYYSPNVGMFVPFSHKFFINVGVSARYDDKKYMQGLFGVEPIEAARSGLPVYQTNAGWQNLQFSLTPIWIITPHWSMSGFLSATRYISQAKRSPILDNKLTYFEGVSLMYNFNPVKF